jgi:hypothetical protein
MVKQTPKIEIITGQSGNQWEFLASSVTELAMLGEAGGGKSWALLLDYLYDYHHPEHNGIVFRKTYKDLEDLIYKASQIYPALGGKYSEQKHCWTFPSGARLWMSYLDHDKDIFRYQGWEFSWIAWDELPQFSKMPYIFMFSRLRCTNGAINKRVRATGNPHGQGVLWVWDRFVDCLPEKSIKYFTTANNRDIEVTKDHGISRMWMKSIRAENRILMDNDPDYEKKLDLLPETLKEAYKYGKLVISDRNMQLISTEWWKRAVNGRNEYKSGFFAMGADYAEGGADKCVTCEGQGNRPLNMREYDYMPTKDYASIIAAYIKKYGFQCRAGVDAIGPGWGVYSNLSSDHGDIFDRIDPCKHKDQRFDSEQKSQWSYKFDNWRSQAFWKLRQDFENGSIDLSAFGTPEGYYDNFHMLQEEALALTYAEENGVIRIAPKKELRKVQMSNGEPGLGRSPDRVDALCIWNWVRDFDYRAQVKEFDKSIDYNHYNMYKRDDQEVSEWIA